MSPVYKLSANSIRNGRTVYGSMLAGNSTYAPPGFESIATVTVGSTTTNTITFSSIPSTYTHLQLRYTARATDSDTQQYIYLRFNSDTGTNYAAHRLRADGSSASVDKSTSANLIYYIGSVPAAQASSNIFGVGVLDILDYTNTNKYKPVRALFAYDTNGSGDVYMGSGLWQSTSAISTITLTKQMTTSGDFSQYSSFALYGIKTA